LVQFIVEVQNFYRQQRSLTNPIIVQCSNGIGRTGAFCVVYIGIDEIDQGNGIVQVTEVVSQLRRQRRSVVAYKEQLKFCYDSILCYAQDLLMRRGILVSRATFGNKLADRTHARPPTDDLVLGLPNLSAIQTSVAKMNVRPPRPPVDSNPASDTATATTSPTRVVHSSSFDSIDGGSQAGFAASSSDMSIQQANERSRSSSPSSSVCSAGGTSPQHRGSSDQKSTGCGVIPPSLTNLPPSLADLQNPAMFRIDPSPTTRRKITKASFFDPSRPSLGAAEGSGSDSGGDPLSQLDPLWTLKAKDQQSASGKS
jgi:tyrosine-protein phosphatase non-receptor type 23